MFECIVLGIVLPCAFSHRGKPERSVLFLQDVEHPLVFQFREGYEFKGSFGSIEYTEVRTGPKRSFTVHIKRVNAASARAYVKFIVVIECRFAFVIDDHQPVFVKTAIYVVAVSTDYDRYVGVEVGLGEGITPNFVVAE